MGSHGGIGSALCRAAEANGMQVVGLDTEQAIREKPAALAGPAIAVDVRDEVSIAAAFKQVGELHGRIDGLAYVTGIGIPPTPAVDHQIGQWDQTMEVNLRGAFLTAVSARPLLKPDASVVFVSSGLAVQADPGFAAYSASKAGLLALAKTLAKEWAPVRVNSVAPGLVNTAFLGGGSGQGKAVDGTVEDWFGPEAGSRHLGDHSAEADCRSGRCCRADALSPGDGFSVRNWTDPARERWKAVALTASFFMDPIT
ncbi:SDR family oxidoreductase (plasmid) [Paraburkholderia strydomiana]